MIIITIAGTIIKAIIISITVPTKKSAFSPCGCKLRRPPHAAMPRRWKPVRSQRHFAGLTAKAGLLFPLAWLSTMLTGEVSRVQGLGLI